MVVDHAQQYCPFPVAEATLAADLGAGVAKCGRDLRCDLLGVGSDDGELAGSFGALDDIAADIAGDEAIQYAQAHRLIVEAQLSVFTRLGIDEERGGGHRGVERKGDPEEVQLLPVLADVFGQNVCAAGGGTLFEADSVHETAHHAAEDHGIDGVVSLRDILKRLQPQLLQIEESEGVGEAETQ